LKQAREDGLVERHAYSLISVKEVGAFKLVELRNPWGNDREWNGDWSDKVESFMIHFYCSFSLTFQ